MPRLLPQNTPSLLSSIKTCPKLFFFPTSKMPCACFPSLKNIHQTTFFKQKQAFPFSTHSPAVVVIFTNTSSPGKSCDGVHSSIPDVLFFLCKPILGPAETDWVFSGFLLLLEVTNENISDGLKCWTRMLCQLVDSCAGGWMAVPVDPWCWVAVRARHIWWQPCHSQADSCCVAVSKRWNSNDAHHKSCDVLEWFVASHNPCVLPEALTNSKTEMILLSWKVTRMWQRSAPS